MGLFQLLLEKIVRHKQQVMLVLTFKFLLGGILLLNSQANITGAVTGSTEFSSTISSAIGIILILISVVLFVEYHGTREYKYKQKT